MRLKGRSAIELAKIFAKGACPKAIDLLGPHGAFAEWRVDMLTGPFPNLGGRLFRHRKQFYATTPSRTPSGVTGCNVFFTNTRWGWFNLDDTNAFDNIDKRGVLFIDYDQPENSSLTRGKIVDRVRTTTDPNVLLGEFYYALDGHSMGPFYFSLTRIAP
jgi:hypothetical protein